MRNYAGHRLAPWLAHVMVSRQETSRPLLTPGEIMQLPPADELVLVSSTPPIRAKKLRYFEDRRFWERLLPSPPLADSAFADRPPERGHDWAGMRVGPAPIAAEGEGQGAGDDGSLQQERHPGLPGELAREIPPDAADPLGLGDDPDEEAASAPLLARMQALAPAVGADGLNQACDRGGDVLPGF